MTMLSVYTSALMTCPCHAGLIQHNLFDKGFSADFYHQESEVSAALPVQWSLIHPCQPHSAHYTLVSAMWSRRKLASLTAAKFYQELHKTNKYFDKMKNLWSENNDDKVTHIYSRLITHQLYKPITVTSTIRPLSSTNAMHAYVLYKKPNPVIYITY